MRQYFSAFACSLMMFGCATNAPLWQHHTENDFPARVSTIITPLGTVLDARRGVTYGPWTVRFGEANPYASYECSQLTGCEIIIADLTCEHASAGRVPCQMKLAKNGNCKIVIPEKQESLQIKCPLDASLESTSKGDQDKISSVPLEKQEVASPEERAVGGPKEAKSQYVPRGLVLGVRGGVAIPTEKVLKNFGNGTTVGPLVNIEALYPLREWVRVGLMFEWHRHDINEWGPDLGTLNVFSFLPTVELRPTREAMRDWGVERFIPYASLGTGINFHSFSNAGRLSNTSVSFSDTFALRLAGGVDFPITSQLLFNTEVAWNRDSGNYKVTGAEAAFNASTLNLLIGLRMHF